MSVRNFFFSLLAFAALLSAAQQSFADVVIPPEVFKTKVKIGISSALTGEAAAYGLDIKNTVLFANEILGGNRYELVFEDDRCDPKQAAAVAHKLINIDHVKFVVGFACSGAMLAAAPIYEKAKIPVITSCASADKISEAGDYVFRTFPRDGLIAQTFVDFLKIKPQLLAILSEETEYAQGLKGNIQGADSDGALTFVTEDYLPGTTDFKPFLLRLRQKNPQGIFLNSQAENGSALMLKALRELNWKIPAYGAYWPASPAFLSIAKSDAEGMKFADSPALSQILSSDGKSLFEAYRAKYGEMKSIEAVFASTFEAFRAIDEAYRSGTDVKEYLYKTKFNGVFGPYSFDSRGEIVGFGFVMKKIENGKVVPLF